MRRLTRQFQRWLYLSHRWLGIGSCILFAAWFASGVVMMYVQFPSLSDVERRRLLPAIDFDRLHVSPAEALAAAGQSTYPRHLRIEMLGAEPVYRIVDWDGGRHAVSALNGNRIEGVSADMALSAIRQRVATASLVGMVDRDQWSVTARYDPLRPFHLIALSDAAGTIVYVSARSGEIALDTTRIERFWNWLGAIPHWIYFTPLRADAPLWRDVVLWLSGPAIVVAVSGIWIGIQRLRLWRRYARNAITPYRGWMQWHHLSGLIGCLFLLAWIFSGWLSMNPNQWFSQSPPVKTALQDYAGYALPHFPLQADTHGKEVSELRLVWLAGQPLAIRYDREGFLLSADQALSSEQIFAAAGRLMPTASMVLAQQLDEEDAYWYSHHHRRELPVLRIGFDDERQTWFHIDPRTGDILGQSSETRRLYRWLFNGLHSFDFAFLLRWRPAWDVLLVTMSVIGLIASLSGIVIGWRRLRRKAARSFPPAKR